MSDLKFSKSHEWIKVETDAAIIGITDYAQGQLGDIVFIELPKVGDRLKYSLQFGIIESTKAASELHSPLTGEVIEVNNDLVNNPQWINQDSYGRGWMLKVKIDNVSEVDSLMDDAAYKEFIAKENHQI